MTRDELKKVAGISSGTIANALGSTQYAVIDRFMAWAHKSVGGGMIMADVIEFGENEMVGLRHLASIFKRHDTKENRAFDALFTGLDSRRAHG